MSLNSSIFKNIDSETKAYWLGFIIADGTIFARLTGQTGIKIALKGSDIGHLEKFKSFLESSNKIGFYKVGSSRCLEKKYECCEFQVSNKEIVADLAKYGITPRKTFDIDLPDIDESLVRHMIRGIWDGDGSVLYRAGNPKYPNNLRPEAQLCGNSLILNSVQDVFISNILDYKVSKLSSITSIFLFRKSGIPARNILNYLYKDSTIYLDRKYEKAVLGINYKSIRESNYVI